MKNLKNRIKNKIRGFTLVEMMVSLAIFGIVAVVAAGALLRIMDANKKAQSIQAAITNLNFALESMSRELRVGMKYECGSGPSNAYGIDGMQMVNSVPCINGDYIAFRSSETALDPQSAGMSQPCTSPPYSIAYVYRFVPLGTSPETYELQKAEQPQPGVADSCGSHPVVSSADFYPIISSKNVTITDYKISVQSDTDSYPFASVRISGYTGASSKNRTYFNVQTAASARLR